MTKDTDTDIKNRYEKFAAQTADLAAGKPLPGNATREENHRLLRIQGEAIVPDWNELVSRRCQGELTDTSRTDQIKALVSTLAKLHGFPAGVSVHEGPRNEMQFARYWSVRMTYSGDTRVFERKRWERLVDRITDELKQFDFVVPNSVGRDWAIDPREIPDDYYERDYDKPGHPPIEDSEWDECEEEEGIDEATPEDDTETLCEDEWVPTDPFLRRCAEWFIDTIVWTFPAPEIGSAPRSRVGSKRSPLARK